MLTSPTQKRTIVHYQPFKVLFQTEIIDVGTALNVPILLKQHTFDTLLPERNLQSEVLSHACLLLLYTWFIAYVAWPMEARQLENWNKE